ncbi:MAG: hypothetical protein ACRCX2_09710 [Paraclostridium sp.]
MKDLITLGIEEAFEKMERITPTTKSKLHFISLEGVDPFNLLKFIKENDIPEHAEFGGLSNGYDSYDDYGLTWAERIPNTQTERERFQKDWFSRNFSNNVGNILKDNGYKKIPYNSLLFKKFDSVCKLTEYRKGNFDLFVEYFSLLWVKE